MSAYPRHRAGDDGWSDWVQPVTIEHENRAYRMACCDCGLVHEVDARVHEGRVQWRMRRHNRATAAVRAHDRLISRIARDHGLTEQALAKAVREQKQKPKGDRMAVGE